MPKQQRAHQSQIQAALTYLRSADPAMARLMDAVGPFTLRPERTRRFSVLARAIISQQVSTAAARTIRGRLEGIVAYISSRKPAFHHSRKRIMAL